MAVSTYVETALTDESPPTSGKATETVHLINWEEPDKNDFAFAEDYYEATVAAKRDAGLSGTKLEAAITEAEKLKRQYYNPAFRLPVTFIEIFPVGLLVTLIAAAVLRKSEVLPAA